MPKEVRLPQLGQTMEEGTIVDCMVAVGDQVKKGDVIFEIETDKATLEMESPAEGFVKAILVEANQTLPVGAPLMVLGDKDEDVPQSFIDALTAGEGVTQGATAVAEAPSAGSAASAAAQTGPVPAKAAGKVKASPRAKKLAEELGVDLTTVAGSGPAGRITEQDVRSAAGSAAQKAARGAEPATTTGEIRLGQSISISRLQRLTAEKMLKSKREIPCFYLSTKADVTELVRLRTELNTGSETKISFNDFIIRAVAIALEEFPLMTGQLAGDKIQLAESISVGLAISVEDGLVAPVVKDVNKKDIRKISRDTQTLIQKARADKLELTDLEGGCITVSNLGGFGADAFIPIPVPGQCSILGVGRITDTCVPVEGNLLVRKLMSLTLSVDHKVANGAYAARFLDRIKSLLEDTTTFA